MEDWLSPEEKAEFKLLLQERINERKRYQARAAAGLPAEQPLYCGDPPNIRLTEYGRRVLGHER